MLRQQYGGGAAAFNIIPVMLRVALWNVCYKVSLDRSAICVSAICVVVKSCYEEAWHDNCFYCRIAIWHDSCLCCFVATLVEYTVLLFGNIHRVLAGFCSISFLLRNNM